MLLGVFFLAALLATRMVPDRGFHAVAIRWEEALKDRLEYDTATLIGYASAVADHMPDGKSGPAIDRKKLEDDSKKLEELTVLVSRAASAGEASRLVMRTREILGLVDLGDTTDSEEFIWTAAHSERYVPFESGWRRAKPSKCWRHR